MSNQIMAEIERSREELDLARELLFIALDCSESEAGRAEIDRCAAVVKHRENRHRDLLSRSIGDTDQTGGEAQGNSDPPKLAEFLLTVLATTRRAEAMIGDLNEHFARECREFGRDRAVRLYWARTMRSLPPLVWRAIGKVVVAAVKRFFGPTAA